MNIQKKFRLNSREIKYITLTKKKKFLRGKILNINLIPQYPNFAFNKFGISVSNKFHKKAVYRNIIRRIFFDIIWKYQLMNKKIDGNYRKIYVSLKKGVNLDVKDADFKQKVRQLLEFDLNKIFNFK